MDLQTGKAYKNKLANWKRDLQDLDFKFRKKRKTQKIAAEAWARRTNCPLKYKCRM